MSDAAHNRTVDGTRTGIQQRVKLECEREQQEQLLLSVIPAYIAAEVRQHAKCFSLYFKSLVFFAFRNVIESLLPYLLFHSCIVLYILYMFLCVYVDLTE